MDRPITLNDVLLVAAAPWLRVTITLTRTLTAVIDVDTSDIGQWDELTRLYGEYTVREISTDEHSGTLRLSITPPTPRPRHGGDA